MLSYFFKLIAQQLLKPGAKFTLSSQSGALWGTNVFNYKNFHFGGKKNTLLKSVFGKIACVHLSVFPEKKETGELPLQKFP